MEKKEHSPQAIRLKQFIDKTGLTHTEFGRQCGFTSPRAMQAIYTDGNIPTAKSLNKIIARFPQLNYDWVLMGYGEMITKPFVNQPSTDSNNKSTTSSFNQINKKLAANDLAVNELGVDVAAIIKNTEHNLLIYTQTMAMLTNKVELMAIAIKDGQDFIVDKEAKRDAFFEKMHADELVKIKSLDQKRLENIRKLDTERRVNREEGQEKLSHKIYLYLKESRELIYAALNKAKDEAVNESQEKFNKQLGKHTINKKPTSTLR
tara:strand:- start:32 stop:817 length:786 start_codon:yes stop_codon:yes gene_type:complete